MCDTPIVLQGIDGEHIEVSCRKCKQCEANRLTDLAGRCYAEALCSDLFAAFTLTYKGETAHAQTLVYSDIQKLFKRLRAAGVSTRYIVAGEYGSRRGRAHWHAVMFFRGDKPELARKLALPPCDTEKQSWKFWPHGFVFVQKPDYYGLLYVLKYAAKDDGSQNTTRRIMMSKKPPLGRAYWAQLAESRIAAGLPFRRSYHLPGARYSNGRPVEYFLQKTSLVDAFEAHRTAWRSLGRKGEPPIAEDDYEAVQKAMAGPVRFVVARKLMGVHDAVPWMAHPLFDRALVAGDGYLVRLRDGRVFYTWVEFDPVYREEHVKSCPVENLASMIALGRGHPVRMPRYMGRLGVPF